MPTAAAAIEQLPTTSEVLVARQPIFDSTLAVYAYELLYRSGRDEEASFGDGDEATQDLITTAFIDIGLERLVCEQPAFVNVTRDLIVAGDLEALPAQRLVFEILEDSPVDEELVASVAALVEKGYRFALDDFVYGPQWEPLLKLAYMVKLDFQNASPEQLREQVELIKGHELLLLGEKLENDADYALAQELGCSYFQGYFFARPRIVAGQRLQGNKLGILRLLSAVHDPDADVERVGELVGQDATLSYKLLRFINSASVAIPQKMASIQRAVVYLGLATVKRMVTLTMIASVDDKPGELFRTALIRARLCEQMCARSGAADAGSAFTVGLFSALDAMMDRPLAELMEELPLASEVSAALLHGEGELGQALECAVSYEQGDWLSVHFANLSPPDVGDAYTEAVEWADGVASGM